MNNIDPVELTKGLPGIPCPIAKTLDVISTKWTFLIIRRCFLSKEHYALVIYKINGWD